MLPSDCPQYSSQPQRTGSAESAPDVETEEKNVSDQSFQTSFLSTPFRPPKSHRSYMASFNRIKTDISMLWKKRAEERKEKLQKKIVDRIRVIEAEEKVKYDAQEKDDIGGEFSLYPCCKRFDNPEKLFEHIKEHHDKDATKCALCGKELSSKSSLDRHLLIHAKWQPYRCCHCNKQFSTNGNMHRHKKTHKGVFKGFKFVKEETASDEEIFLPRKSKRAATKQNGSTKLKEQIAELDAVEIESALPSKPVKRKMKSSAGGTLNKQTPKRTKVDNCGPSKCGNIVDNEAKLEIDKTKGDNEDIKVEVPFPELAPEPEVFHPEIKKENSREISNLNEGSPSKQEFIATLGLRNACQSKEKNKVIGFDAKKFLGLAQLFDEFLEQGKKGSLIQNKKEECLQEERKLTDTIKEEDAENPTGRELVIDCDKEPNDFADITSILSNMRSQPKVGVSDVPLKVKVEGVCAENSSNNSFNNVDGHWLPESPETSTEANFFVPSSNNPPLNASVKEEEAQPKAQYFCEHCKKVFKNKHILQKHTIKHNKPKPFKCNECGAKLLNKPNAIRHVIKVHKKRRGVAKTLIDYNLDDGPSTGTKTICEWCGQDFTSNLILEHHKRASTGCRAKPFICLICNKSFSTKNNGKRHQARHHGDSQAENCIVRNTLAAEKEPKAEEMLSLPSDDKTDETSEIQRNDLSSTCSDPELHGESNLSLPTKEMDAAYSLIDMFSQVPTHVHNKDSIDSHEQNGTDILNNIPINMETHTPYDMREEINLQECPLDLSIRPMDLSTKPDDNYSDCSFEKHLGFSSVFLTPKKEEDPPSLFTGAERECAFLTETPLNLVKKKVEHNSIQDAGTSSTRHISSLPRRGITLFTGAALPKSKSPNATLLDDPKPAAVKCDFCFISFANNSNKRRHEKKQHQFQSQETANFHSIPVCIEKKNRGLATKSILSEKTKEALITKVSSKPNGSAVDYSIHGTCELTHPLGALNSEAENGDLASVSSLIHTANSPQLKKYLTSDNCDVVTNPEEVPAENNGGTSPKSTDQKLDSKRSTDKYWCAICQKEFTCKSSFNRHSVIHTKERPYDCPECTKTFTVKSNRDRHLKRIHKLAFPLAGKSVLSRKRQPKKSAVVVPNETTAMTINKDLPSQCNKENQRLYSPS